MPNPTLIHPRGSKTEHFLAIADLYIALDQPKIYEVEPTISEDYRPDAYARLDVPVIVEVQRSTISSKKMQEKVDLFVKSASRKQHDARTLWIIADRPYTVKAPSGFQIVQRSMSYFNKESSA